jgi:hypothetical protein
MKPLLDGYGHWSHTSIELGTRKNGSIDNVQPWELTTFEWGLKEVSKRFENSGAERVSDECPAYNRHGLAFGNRRTQVGDAPDLISLILKDDGFDEILFSRFPEAAARYAWGCDLS